MAATMSATPGGYTADQEAAARRNLDAHGFTGITVDAAYRLLTVFAADPSPLFASSHVPSPQPPSASSRRSASGNTRRRRRRAEPSPVSHGTDSDGDVVSVPSPIATRPHPRAARDTPGAAGDSGSASGASVHSDDSAHDTSGSAADSGGGGGGGGSGSTGTGTGTGTVTASQQSTVSVLKMKGRALVSSSDESEEDILTASGVAHRSPSKRLTASGDSGSDSDGSVVRRRHTRSTVVVAATAVDATPSPVATRRSERTLSSRAQARRDAKARALKLLKRRKLAAELNRSGSDSDADDGASASGRKRKRRLVPVFANETKQQRELRELRDRAEFGLEHDKAREVFRVGAGYASRGCHTPMQRSHAVHVLCVAVPSCGCVGDVVAMLCRGEVKYASDPESDAASDSPEEMPLDKFIVDDDDALYVPTAARHAVSRCKPSASRNAYVVESHRYIANASQSSLRKREARRKARGRNKQQRARKRQRSSVSDGEGSSDGGGSVDSVSAHRQLLFSQTLQDVGLSVEDGVGLDGGEHKHRNGDRDDSGGDEEDDDDLHSSVLARHGLALRSGVDTPEAFRLWCQYHLLSLAFPNWASELCDDKSARVRKERDIYFPAVRKVGCARH